METAQLARAFLLLVALVRDQIQDGDPQLLTELNAYIELYTQRTRAQALAPLHTTRRGEALLAAADERAAQREEK